MSSVGEATIRIGELARRTGLTPGVLRAWERRYALLQPTRTQGGFRLYARGDEARVLRMKAFMASGVGAAQAAQLALAPARQPPEGPVGGTARDDRAAALDRALLSFDGDEANAALDGLLATETLEHSFDLVITPALLRLGRRLVAGEISVAQEHFASNLLRGRLFALARGWDRGTGPRALLACAPGEHHDIALIVFGLALHEHGWRVTYLGQDTPLADVAIAARATLPAIAVIAATDPARLASIQGQLTELAREVPLALAGAGATEALARAVGARHLADGVLASARAIAGR